MAETQNKLTPKQEAFCLYYAIEKLSQRQAYIKAYGQGNQSEKSIDEKASRLVKTVKVEARLEELRNTLTEAVLWSKADMIQDLKDIAKECKTASVVTHYFGKGDNKGSEERIDSRARAVAVKAISEAGTMLGYRQPDTAVTVTVKLEDYLKKVEGKDEY